MDSHAILIRSLFLGLMMEKWMISAEVAAQFSRAQKCAQVMPGLPNQGLSDVAAQAADGQEGRAFGPIA